MLWRVDRAGGGNRAALRGAWREMFKEGGRGRPPPGPPPTGGPKHQDKLGGRQKGHALQNGFSESGGGFLSSGLGAAMTSGDDQLLPRAVAGDQAALAALLERHGAVVRATLQRSYHRRLKGEVDLDDVMQVTYLEAFLRIGAFTWPSSGGGSGAFSAWLRRIAENNIRDAIRKSDAADRRRSPVGHAAMAAADSCRGLVELVADEQSPIRLAGRGETERLLEAALRELPPDYERVLRLYDLEGRTGPEVARVMGRSHGAIKMLVARARDRLGELLGSGSKFFSRGGGG